MMFRVLLHRLRSLQNFRHSFVTAAAATAPNNLAYSHKDVSVTETSTSLWTRVNSLLCLQ